MKRSVLLSLIRVAGYHGDTRTFTRLLVENRISRAVADTAFLAGKRAKERGVPCTCHACKEGAK
jgi:hypothetical protein